MRGARPVKVELEGKGGNLRNIKIVKYISVKCMAKWLKNPKLYEKQMK